MLVDGLAMNGNLRIEYRSNMHLGQAGDGGVLFVPGILGSADSFREELSVVSPIPGIAVSLRGRGRSDGPEHGYSLQDQVGDLQAVFDSTPLRPVVVYGYSVGVPIALEFAARNRAHMAGLIIVDYPAKYPAFSERWVERALASEAGRGRETVIRGIRDNAEETDLWARIQELTCPILVIRGEPSRGGLIKDEDVAKYMEALPQTQVITFAESGHDIWNPSKDRYLKTVREFVHKVLGRQVRA